MKRTLMSETVGPSLEWRELRSGRKSGNSHQSATGQGKSQDQKSKDDTNFQKGNTDPTDPTKQKQRNQ